MVPFHPAAAKAWASFGDKDANLRDCILNPYYGDRFIPNKYGSGEKFRFWLFREYNGADIVNQNHKPFIRFTDEQYATLFLLQWS